MEPEEKVWEILLSAEKKDYERICTDYGITDFRGMLKKLNEMKKEREEEIAEVQKSGFVLFVYKCIEESGFYSCKSDLFSLYLLWFMQAPDHYFNLTCISLS